MAKIKIKLQKNYKLQENHHELRNRIVISEIGNVTFTVNEKNIAI